jgi:hypothetical protein
VRWLLPATPWCASLLGDDVTKTKRYGQRARYLIAHFHIKSEPLGVYPIGSDLAAIEYALHELGHAFTMGFLQMPRKLPGAIEGTLARYSNVTCDHLEIDTTFVTYQAMVALKLAQPEDKHKFAVQCVSSLQTNRYQERVYLVLDEMEERNDDKVLQVIVSNLASMMRAPWRAVLATYSLPDDSPG